MYKAGSQYGSLCTLHTQHPGWNMGRGCAVLIKVVAASLWRIIRNPRRPVSAFGGAVSRWLDRIPYSSQSGLILVDFGGMNAGPPTEPGAMRW